MDQTKINIEDAKALRVEMEMEFAEVEQILRKVHEECSADPTEDDDVLKAIQAAGDQLEETWDGWKMCVRMQLTYSKSQ